MARRRTLGKQYYKNRQKNYNISKIKRVKRIKTRTRKLGRGRGLLSMLGISTRPPILGTSIGRPRATVRLGPAEDPEIKVRILDKSAALQAQSNDLKDMNASLPNIFYIVTGDPFSRIYISNKTENHYINMYERHIKGLIDHLPTSYDFKVPVVLHTMEVIHGLISEFRNTLENYKIEHTRNNEIKFKEVMTLLSNMMDNSNIN